MRSRSLARLLVAALPIACGDGTLGGGLPVTDGGVVRVDAVGADHDARSVDAGRVAPDAEADAEARDARPAQADGTAGSVDGGSPRVDAAPAPGPTDPEPRAPCVSGRCWHTEATVGRCRRRALDEDFSTGRYNVHVWATTSRGDAETVLSLRATGGAWAPVLLVAEPDGTILFDGSIGRVRDGLAVSGEDDGATVRLRGEADLPVLVYVTSWAVVRSGFVELMPRAATYTLQVESRCDDQPVVGCVVAGHEVREPACGWLEYVGREVVPRLEGPRDERIRAAAVVAWWSLKEGVLFLDNAIAYSNCHFDGEGDRRIGPLETCQGRAWQVGVAAVQVPGRDLEPLTATARRLFPEQTVDETLAQTARAAGLDAGAVAAVAGASREGDASLRRSWLLRTSAVGFTFQSPTVARECVYDTQRWCFGDRWEATRLFAPDRETALRAIDDIAALFGTLAP